MVCIRFRRFESIWSTEGETIWMKFSTALFRTKHQMLSTRFGPVRSASFGLFFVKLVVHFSWTKESRSKNRAPHSLSESNGEEIIKNGSVRLCFHTFRAWACQPILSVCSTLRREKAALGCRCRVDGRSSVPVIASLRWKARQKRSASGWI